LVFVLLLFVPFLTESAPEPDSSAVPPLLGYGAPSAAAERASDPTSHQADEQKWKEAGQIPQVAQVIESAAAGIDKAAADFETALASP
jgi:hypothetical protein